MDWNWFFSSLSQSSAAIVGIFGAFIITKILSNQALFGEKSARLKSLQATASKLAGSAENLAFAWYVRLTKKQQLEEAEDLLERDATLSAEELYARLRLPPFLLRDEAIRDLAALKDRRTRAAEAKRQRLEEAAKRQAERRKNVGSLGDLGSLASTEMHSASPFLRHCRLVSLLFIRMQNSRRSGKQSETSMSNWHMAARANQTSALLIEVRST